MQYLVHGQDGIGEKEIWRDDAVRSIRHAATGNRVRQAGFPGREVQGTVRYLSSYCSTHTYYRCTQFSGPGVCSARACLGGRRYQEVLLLHASSS